VIILSYGMTKSGSTLAFELCKAVLQQNGSDQRRLPEDVIPPPHHINFLTDVSVENLKALLAEVKPSEKVAVKVHAPIGKEEMALVESCVADGTMKVHVNYRDPREVCLSLVDAGAKAREKNRPAFSEIRTLEDAAKVVRRQLGTCRKWGSIKGVFYLFYNDVAFDTRAVADRMSIDFGFGPLSDEDYKKVADEVFNEAFTQKNKAAKDRYKDDLTVRQNEFLLEEIKPAANFIRKVCEQSDFNWFAAARDVDWE
jgi:hypothetical protein